MSTNKIGIGAFVRIASYITSLARLNLYNAARKAGVKNVYYCDTDSLYVNDEGMDRLTNSDMVHNTELGKWKYE